MAIAIATTSTNGTPSTSLVITKPTGLASGEHMVAVIGYATAGTTRQTITPPAGWSTGPDAYIEDGGNNTRTRVTQFYKTADSSDAAASNFTFTCAVAISGLIHRVTGGSPTIFFTTSNSTSSSNDNSPVSVDVTVTPVRVDSLLVVGIGTAAATTVSNYAIATDNPTWSESYDSNGISSANAVRSAMTATGNLSFDHAGDTNTDVAVTISVFCPAISVTVTPDPVTGTGTANSPTVTGGATVSVNPVTGTGTANDPASAGQATWSKTQRNTTSWTNQSQS